MKRPADIPKQPQPVVTLMIIPKLLERPQGRPDAHLGAVED